MEQDLGVSLRLRVVSFLCAPLQALRVTGAPQGRQGTRLRGRPSLYLQSPALKALPPHRTSGTALKRHLNSKRDRKRWYEIKIGRPEVRW